LVVLVGPGFDYYAGVLYLENGSLGEIHFVDVREILGKG